jgi:hypothetical protein
MSDTVTVMDNELLRLRVQFHLGRPYIHVTVRKWSHTLYKAYLRVWALLLQQLAKDGHPVAFSVIPEGDNKLYKFQLMFGMKEEMRDDGHILMRINTEV